MNRFRVLAIGTLMTVALAAAAQQNSTEVASDNTAAGQRARQNGVPTVDEQMRLFTERLELSTDQQSRIKPALQQLHDATLKLVHDQSMSRDERLQNVRPLRMKADKEIRAVLNDDQKKKLDQVEQESHPELHGDLH